MACDPKTLAREASCFFCLPPGYYYPVKLAILARWLKILSPGADTSVAALMRDASCFACPPNAQLGPVRLALICEATSGPAPPPTPPVPLDFTIDLSSVAGNTVLIWTDAGGATTIEIWKSVNGGAYAIYDTVAGAVTTYNDIAAMGALDYWEYKIAAVGMSTSAFTTPAGAANGIDDHASVNISFPNLIISYDVIALDSNAALITASFPRMARAAALSFFDDTSLTSLSVPVLGGTISDIVGYNCTSLLAMDFPSVITTTNSIVLFGNTSAVTADFGSLTTVGSTFVINGCTALTALDLPMLASVGNVFSVADNISMGSFTVPSLATVASSFTITNCGAITTLNLNSLTVTGDLSFALSFGAANINVSLPALITVGGDLSFSGCAANLKNISAPNLGAVANGIFSDCTGLLSVTLTSLVIVGASLSFANDVALPSLSLPALLNINGNFNCSSCLSLVTFTAPSLVFSDGFLISFDSDALNQASVDAILAAGVASGLTTSDFELANGTNSGPSLPCINPLSDCFALQAAGNTVNTN